MFKVLGIALGVYVGYAVFSGSVVAKSGIRARTVVRDETPGYFWTVIAVYAVLALALMLVF